MLDVLAITNLYPPHSLGGYEGACRDVVQRFRERGHRVEVLTSTWRRPEVEADAFDEMGVHRDLRLTSTFVPLRPPPLRWSDERANARVLRERLAEAQPDVLSIWNMAGLSLGLLTELQQSGVPIVYVVCDDWLVGCAERDPWLAPFRSRPKLGRIVAAATGTATEVPDLGRMGSFCFASEWLRRHCEAATGQSFPASMVTPLGVDLRDFPLASSPRTRPFAGRLLYVGRLDKAKGVHTLVRALARLPGSMTLDVIGPGDASQVGELSALVSQLGLDQRVRFATAAREELRARYQAADVTVFPSEWQEPFGIVPLEAMACAVPVIATGTGGSGEYLRDGVNCLLFSPGDSAALAAAANRLAGDEDLRIRVVAGGLNTASEFTVDALADRLERVHSSARGGGSGVGSTPGP